LRSAEKIGYPVTLIVTASNGQQFTWPDIDSAEYLRTTLDAARRYGSSIELEGRVSGESWQLLLVGKSPLALFQAGVFHDPASIHPETLRMAVALSGQLDSGLMIIKLRTPDITFPLAESGGAFLDFELAPNLEELLGAHPALLQIAATAFVDWLFPPARSARIPIVAVTGTNGKTTTCRMIEFIARKSGMGTGMACTGANYILGQLPDEESRVGTGRQFRLFDIPEVEIAIVEEFLGTIIGTGFAYHYSDVAVCTNVTQDHFGRVGIHDMDTLAAAKFLAVQRARHAAVLNADNSYSFDMMGRSSAKKIGLVSMRQNAEDLLKALDRPGVVCTLENSPDGRWLVFNDGEQRRPLMRESEIPAGFDGKAAHNVCNAMQAALACWFVGMNLEQIRSGLADFRTDFDTAPGRLNFMQGLPFQFILDYAHNLDGYRVLCEFVDKIQISGRKILCVAAAGDRQDKEIREAITFLVNHFDFFVCRSYPQLRGRQPGEIPRLIKRCLTDAGVPESAIQLEFDANDAVRSALETASPGDLLIVLSGGNEFKQIWTLAEALKVHSPGHPDQIEAFNPSGH
jgi:cyanophycin synthetase